MINPWKEIHLICKDQVHKTSFPQWALIPDTDATQVRKPPTGKHEKPQSKHAYSKLQTDMKDKP